MSEKKGDNLGKTQARISHKMALWRIFEPKRGGVTVEGRHCIVESISDRVAK